LGWKEIISEDGSGLRTMPLIMRLKRIGVFGETDKGRGIITESIPSGQLKIGGDKK